MQYRPDLDRSEEAGWKKYCEERQPTEQEQQRWSSIYLAICLLFASVNVVI